MLGTPAYMAPEQARGALDTLDERADVFGLGSILCEILTGQPAYTGRTSAELYRKAERAELADALARLDACGADAELVALARSCLAAAPKDRPRDAGVVLAGLTAYLAGVEQRLRAAGLAQAQAEARAAEERKRRVLTVALAASVLATALLVAGGWIWVARDQAARDGEDGRRGQQGPRRGHADARPGPVGSRATPAQWVEAIEAARRAEALLAQGEEAGDLRGRVRALLTAIARERAEAEAAEKDRRMVERLAEIHADFGVHLDHAKMDAEYAAAFRDYGVDVDALDPAEAGARIAARPDAAECSAPSTSGFSSRRRQNPTRVRGDSSPSPRRRTPTPGGTGSATRSTWRRRTGGRPLRSSSSSPPRPLWPTSPARPWPGWPPPSRILAIARRPSPCSGCPAGPPRRFLDQLRPRDDPLGTGQPDEAIRFFSVAVAVRPRSDLALDNLGTALHEAGRLEEAAATLRQACGSGPKMPRSASASGPCCWTWAMPTAEAEFREAKRLRPGDFMVRDQIADVFMEKGEWDAAIAELREAVDQEPENARAHEALGIALWNTGRLDEAIASFREAVRLDPRLRLGVFPSRPGAAGEGRVRRGDRVAPAGSSTARPGRTGGPPRPRPCTRPSGWSRWTPGSPPCSAARTGRPTPTRPPASPASAPRGNLCNLGPPLGRGVRRPAVARRRPEGGAPLPRRPRRGAGRSPARARTTRHPTLPSATRWRRQALDWLEADLAVLQKSAGVGMPRDRSSLPRRLGLWRVDPAFAGLRDEAALSVLPESEREACRALWSEVDSLQTKVRKNVRPAAPGPPS